MKGNLTMPKTLFLATVIILALAAPALSQSSPKAKYTTQKLIEMSRQYVNYQTSALVVRDDGLTLTHSGPMNVLVVKGRVSGQLESPVVTIKDAEAVVTGIVVFKGLSGSSRDQRSPIKIWFIKDNGRWKTVSLCVGDCGLN
jgi:hypothetical protein